MARGKPRRGTKSKSAEAGGPDATEDRRRRSGDRRGGSSDRRRASRRADPHEDTDDELISQSAFENIYQAAETLLPPAGRVSQRQRAEAGWPVERELPRLQTLSGDGAPAGPAPAGGPCPPRPGPEASAPAHAEVELEHTLASWRAPGEAEPLGPLAELRKLLEQATDREQLGGIVARHALSRARRVILLVRRGETWLGWTGAGDGVCSERIASLVIPPVEGTIFGLLAATGGGPYLGPLADHPFHRRFLGELGFEPPASVALLPVYHGERAEIALYLDGGPGGRVSPDLGDLLVLAQQLPRALERLERARRRG